MITNEKTSNNYASLITVQSFSKVLKLALEYVGKCSRKNWFPGPCREGVDYLICEGIYLSFLGVNVELECRKIYSTQNGQ